MQTQQTKKTVLGTEIDFEALVKKIMDNSYYSNEAVKKREREPFKEVLDKKANK